MTEPMVLWKKVLGDFKEENPNGTHVPTWEKVLIIVLRIIIFPFKMIFKILTW